MDGTGEATQNQDQDQDADRSQQGVSILTAWMILQGDPFPVSRRDHLQPRW